MRLNQAATGAPLLLSETGLYRSIAAKELHGAASAFAPSHPLWSDGSDKQRWLLVPDGARIDGRVETSWQFPVGTFAFKEFSIAGRRLETRLIARTGAGPDEYWMGSFVWNEDESDARYVRDGALDVRGTQHDVPSTRNCETCHRGDPARFLGLSAVQAPQLPAAQLASGPGDAFAPPGDAIEAAALGYLHANCAHCHNPSGSARPDTDLDLRLRPTDRVLQSTLAYTSTIDVPLQYFGAALGTLRVVPGDPERSALLQRMRERGNRTQMPPLGSELIDADGVTLIRQWISRL